jgi:LacI family transcriptional regulator
MVKRPDPSSAALSVGVLVNWSAHHQTQAALGVKEALVRWPEFQMVVVSAETDWRERLRQTRLAGLIGFLRESHKPFVAEMAVPAVNFSTAAMEVFPSVLPDHEAIGRSAGEHLIEQGHRRLAFVQYAGQHFAQLRWEGFHQAATDAGAEVERSTWDGGAGSGIEDLARRFSGVMVADDTGARRMAVACMESGIEVPGELAIVAGNNDWPMCEMAPVSISSVDMNARQVGRSGMELLLGLIDGGRPPSQPLVVPAGSVQARRSSDALRVDDPELRRAAEFIRARACEGITIDDVMAEATVSRRTLEKRFRRQFGRSMLDEIRRVRFLRARRLLEDTDLTIHQVAFECGFTEHSWFSELFARHLGLAPSEYRARHRRLR